MTDHRIGDVRFREEHLLSVAECEALIDAFAPRLVKSDLRGRTSSIAKRLEDATLPGIERLRQRFAAFSGLPELHQELWQGIRYLPGEEYRAHWDWFPDGDPRLADGGQRVYSAVLYLNTTAGGATTFPLLGGACVTPEPGLLVMWNLTDNRGRVLHESKHAATPPSSGEKWALVTWAREYPARMPLS